MPFVIHDELGKHTITTYVYYTDKTCHTVINVEDFSYNY